MPRDGGAGPEGGGLDGLLARRREKEALARETPWEATLRKERERKQARKKAIKEKMNVAKVCMYATKRRRTYGSSGAGVGVGEAIAGLGECRRVIHRREGESDGPFALWTSLPVPHWALTTVL